MAVGEPYFCDHDFQLALNVRLREAAAEGLHERRSDHAAPGGFRGAPPMRLRRPWPGHSWPHELCACLFRRAGRAHA
eukprot:5187704-Pyramimonas_sp.AAC.1